MISNDEIMKWGNVGRCQIGPRIGEGGTGVVHRGRHLDLQLDVAIKFLYAQSSTSVDATERFFREARLAARITHNSLVRVFDCGMIDAFPYIVMELIDGQSLASHLAERGRLPVARCLQITSQIVEALDYAWKTLGLIHRDIKPGNILLTQNGQPKLADFGLAKSDLTSNDLTRTAAGVMMGTPTYMPPEQFVDAASADLRSDVYSLGVVLHHMLSGRPPFEANSVFALMKLIEQGNPAPLPTDVPRAVCRIVERMLEKDPSERFQGYGELQSALVAAQSSLGEPETLIGEKIHTAIEPVSSNHPRSFDSRHVAPANPTENRVLLIVDVQNDFCAQGALPVPFGEEVIPVINRLSRRFAHVIMTQDWHCEDHLSFATSHPGKRPYDEIDLPYGRQVLWPDHCVRDTRGAEFHPDIDVENCELIIRKGYRREIDSYSAFFENDRHTPTGLTGYLRERGLTRLFIAGLATDYCVADTALDARRLGFEVTVIENACRGIDINGTVAAAWEKMIGAGVVRA